LTAATGKFDDLMPRIITALVIVAVFLAVVRFGGVWFVLLVSAVAGLLVYEFTRLLGAKGGPAIGMALAGAAALGVVQWLPYGAALPIFAAIAITGLSLVPAHRPLYLIGVVLILGVCAGFVARFQDLGLWWEFWLITVVVTTDILGYFAGRLIGGPKLWPQVSPKKTWSGAVAGWMGAAVIGGVFMGVLNANAVLIALSVGLSLASQAGDIVESAIKRKTGNKDSSRLLPGHGGVLDRLDGLLGATFIFLILEYLFGLPVMQAG
jgi:phosphatidate cytidylyltransferase